MNRSRTLSSTGCPSSAASRGDEGVPIQLAQCWFPGLAISNAKIKKIYFQIKYREAVFFQTPLGNCYGLKLPNCRLQLKSSLLRYLLQFSAHFRSLVRYIAAPYTSLISCHPSAIIIISLIRTNAAWTKIKHTQWHTRNYTKRHNSDQTNLEK